jgi:hypothetical protein
MCLILNGYRVVLFESPDRNPLDSCLWGWMMDEVYKLKVDTPDELLARILDAAASIKKREDQVRRTARDLHTRVAKCAEVDGGIFRTFNVNRNRLLISV